MPRVTVPTLEAILDKKFAVLDQGVVRVIDYMGDDATVVQAARNSYGAGTKTPSDDRSLIRYLMRQQHTTPFEMCEIKLHVRVPMDTWRQWIRQRTASVNEYSTRYSEAIDAMQTTPADQWRRQSQHNKQGSEEYHVLSLEQGCDLSDGEAALLMHAREVYRERLVAGVSREQARKDLPLSTYTEAYWKIDLHNLLKFLGQRLGAHAQQEIRAYATVIAEIVKQWVPLTYEAFTDYRLDAMTLSGPELRIIAALDNADRDSPCLDPRFQALWDKLPTREQRALAAKLGRLGMPVPLAREKVSMEEKP